MDKPSAFGRVRDRLAALQNRSEESPDVVPGGPGSPGQQDAMRETLEILSDPAMLQRVQAGRKAVATGDVVALEPILRGEYSVVVAGPVLREFGPAAALLELVGGLVTTPTEQGRALGMGLTGVWSTRSGAQRVLYAVHRGQRLVTVVSVDAP